MVCVLPCLRAGVLNLVLLLVAKFSGNVARTSDSRHLTASSTQGPIHAAASLFFKDTDASENYVAGDVVYRRATDETDIMSYALYWGTGDEKTVNTPLARKQVASNSDSKPECQSSDHCSRIDILPNEQGWQVNTKGNSYKRNERLTIKVQGPGEIVVTSLNTERTYDYLQIGNRKYSGRMDQFKVALDDGQENIKWRSDHSEQRSGWSFVFKPARGTEEFEQIPIPRIDIPQGVTHLVLFSANDDAEMQKGVSFPIMDKTALTTSPQGLSLVDTDKRRGYLAGAVSFSSIGPANADHIDIVWGGSANSTLGPCSGVAGYTFEFSIDDCSGYNNHLKTMSAPFVASKTADMGQGMAFDGTLIASAASSTSLNVVNFTVMAWVKPKSLSTEVVRLVGKGKAGENSYGLRLYEGGLVECKLDSRCEYEEGIRYYPNMQGAQRTTEENIGKCQERCATTSGCLHFSFYRYYSFCYLQSSGARKYRSSSYTAGPRSCNHPPRCHTQEKIQVDTWSHLACTYDGKTISLYVDAALKKECTWVGVPLSSSEPLTLGGMDVSAPKFDGDMDDVHVNNRALSAAEIQIYSSPAKLARARVDTTTQEISLQSAAIPPGATHLLAYSMRGWEVSSPAAKPLSDLDVVVPVHEPTSIYFSDVDPASGILRGTAFVEKAAVEDDITHYVVHWANATGDVSGPIVASVPATGTSSALSLGGRSKGLCVGRPDPEATKLDSIGGDSEARQEQCRTHCRAIPGMLGCALITSGSGQGCYVYKTAVMGQESSSVTNAYCWPVPHHRIAGSSSTTRGRLEVFVDNSWGTVCNADFDDVDAGVACRHMGYQSGRALQSSDVPAGTGTIHLKDLKCDGDEPSLTLCPTEDGGVESGAADLLRDGFVYMATGTTGTLCTHSMDVGVECSGALAAGSTGPVSLYAVDIFNVRPDNATHIIAFSAYGRSLMDSGANRSVLDHTALNYRPDSVTFSDSDPATGTLAGNVTISGLLSEVDYSFVHTGKCSQGKIEGSGSRVATAGECASVCRRTASCVYFAYADPVDEDTSHCPENFPACYSDGDCVTSECASGCPWQRGLNYIDGYDNKGSDCIGDYQATRTGKSTGGWRLVAPTTNSGWAWDVPRIKLFSGNREVVPTTYGCEFIESGSHPSDYYSKANAFRSSGMWGGRKGSSTFFYIGFQGCTKELPDLTKVTIQQQGGHYATVIELEYLDKDANAWVLRTRTTGNQANTLNTLIVQPNNNCKLYQQLAPNACSPKADADYKTYRLTVRDATWLPLKDFDCDQSSTSYGGRCSRGIDGNSNTRWSGNSCTHTGSSGNRNWWSVTLQGPHSIQKVKVTNRDTWGNRLNNFDVLVDGMVCAEKQQIDTGETKEVPCSAVGTTLKIRNGGNNILTLCEVGVYGSPSADYVLMRPGIASVNGAPDIWIPEGDQQGQGVHACFEAVMASAQCAKDYFTYQARGSPTRCGCKGQGVLHVESETDSDSTYDFYQINAVKIKDDCDETLTGDGADYIGCQALTRTGKVCQPWTSQSPHQHTRTPTEYPSKGLGTHSYCRNPDGQLTIWCYTSDPGTRWEFCEPVPSASLVYNLYWAVTDDVRLPLPALGSVAYKAGGPVTFQVPSGTSMPQTATRILVFAEGDCAGSTNCMALSGTAALVSDFNLMDCPAKIEFEDTDNAPAKFGGVVTVMRAPSEDASGITAYDIYWGTGKAEQANAQKLSKLETLATEAPKRSVVVKMMDSYGDGWNRNRYEIKSSSGASIADGTMESGRLKYDTINGFVPGESYTISVGGGLYKSEVSWELYLDTRNGARLASGVADDVREVFQIDGSSGASVHSAASIAWTMPEGTSAHAGATHLLVYAVKPGSPAAAYGASVVLDDISPPVVVAKGLTFTDMDSRLGFVSGQVNITRADNEADATLYNLYWGQSPNLKIGFERDPGLLAEFFYFKQGLGNRLPQLEGRTPDVTRADEVVNYGAVSSQRRSAWSGLKERDHFAARWTGHVQIEQAGEYLFYLGSDDGSKLYIDGTLFVDHDGLHSTSWKWARKHFETGFHSLRLLYCEKTGDASMMLHYNGPDTNNRKVLIPKSKLWHGEKLRSYVGNVSIAGATGNTLQFDLPSNSVLPDVTTHLLVYAASDTSESYNATSIPLTDYVVPSNVAGNITFKDTDPVGASFGGVATIVRASNEDDISHYVVYWGDQSNQKIPGSSGVAVLYTNSTSNEVTIPAGANPPSQQATNFVVISAYGTQEMQHGTGVAVTDYAPPLYTANNASFQDIDGVMGTIGGVLSMERPTSEDTIWGYRVYWGRSASARLAGGLPGFKAEFWWWKTSQSRLPTDLSLEPDLTRVDLEVNHPINRRGGSGSAWEGLRGRRDRFVARWTGRLMITTEGRYNFKCTSDDGSRLWIGGTLVVDNDGLHGTRSRTSYVQLEKGEHDILLTFFENYGSATMVLEYRGVDTSNNWKLVSSEVVRHGDVSRGPIGEVPKSDGDATHAIMTLPRGTSVPVGGTHFLVYAIGEQNATAEKESTVFVATTATDNVMPEHPARELMFEDEDQAEGILDGVLTITRAEVETQITAYMIYWGSTNVSKLSDLAPIGSVAPSAETNLRAAEISLRGRPCSQSSTGHGGICSRGIDGQSNTRYSAGSCTHTSFPRNGDKAWWKVDLPAVQAIATIGVTNRGDCCHTRLNGFNVLVDDKPCATDVQIGDGETKLVPCSAKGKEVKIEVAGNYLTLCEVKVYKDHESKRFFNLGKVNLMGFPCSQSTTSFGGLCSRGIDGNSNSRYSQGSCTHTSYHHGSNTAWWKVTLPLNQSFEKISVTNRGDCCGTRLTGFDVLVDGQLCAASVPINQGETKEVPCRATGRELKIQKRGTYLTVCEVTAYRSQAIPTGATHFLVYSSYHGTELATPAALQFSDYYPPKNWPTNVSFNDSNSTLGTVAGVAVLTPSADLTGVSEYRIYWGKSSTEKIGVGKPGLLAEFFNFEQRSRIPSFAGRTATISRVDDKVDYKNTGSYWLGLNFRDEFAARWTGYLKIQEEGTYYFWMGSDDGSRLYIDDSEVIDNDGLHSFRWNSGSVLLTTGYHSIKMLFFENRGSAGMKLEYRGADTGNQRILVPPSAFFHGSLDNAMLGTVASTGDGSPVQFTIDATTIAESATHLLAFSAGPTGESLQCASTPIHDVAVPVHPAGGVSFTDSNISQGALGGNITIDRASDEVDVTHYNVYFGNSSTTKLPGQDSLIVSFEVDKSEDSTVGGCGAKGTDKTPFGRGQTRSDSRIMNGQTASECEWKWQVRLTTSGGSYFCGGVLISPRWVLTAARCVRSRHAHHIRVVAGDLDRTGSTSTYEVTKRVQQIIKHPSYSSTTMDYDFALVKLQDEFDMGNCIAPACLPREDVQGGEECVVTGWGKTASNKPNAHMLQESIVVTLTNEACNARVSSPQLSITEQMICAQGTTSAGASHCQGDWGGPLVCNKDKGPFSVHGLTSWGDGCQNGQMPGVYARVAEVLPWIESNTGLTPPADTRLKHTLDATLPAGATHILVFTSYNGGEMLTPTATELVDYFPPPGGPLDVSFVDVDATEGEVAGTITVTRAADESGIAYYTLYWGIGTEKSDVIATLDVASNVTFEIEANTKIPSHVTQILAFSSTSNGDSVDFKHVTIVDLDKSLVSGGIDFIDTDVSRYKIGGVLTVQRALEEFSLREYNIYWGTATTGCQKLVSTPLATVPVTVQLTEPECQDGDGCDSNLIDISLVAANTWTVSRLDGYRVNERGTIVLTGPGTVTWDRLSTEKGYDYIKIANSKYSGEAKPDLPIVLGEGTHTVTWYSDGTVTMDGWAFTFRKTITAGSLFYTLAAGTTMPAAATHLLVYSELMTGGEDDLCARQAVTDYAPPGGVPQGVEFTDVDERAGKIGGIVSIEQARDTTSVISYKVWWGNGSTRHAADDGTFTLLAEVNGTSATLTAIVDSGTVIPAGATHLLAYTVGEFGQGEYSSNVSIWDYAPPTSAAQAIAFTDTDARLGWIGGEASLTRADDGTGISTYNLYWASGDTKLDMIAKGQAVWDTTPVCSSEDDTCDSISITEKKTGIWEISRGSATYGNFEKATVVFQGPATLSFSVFNTEKNFDTLDVLGVSYSGTDLPGTGEPPTISIPTGSHQIKWETDYQNSGVGWTFELSYSTSVPIKVAVEPTMPPANATHLLVLTSGVGGEMSTGITTLIEDYAPPIETALTIDFEDVDLGIGTIGGAVTVTRPATATPGLMQYQVFWGSSETSVLDTLPEVGDATGNSTLVIPIPNDTAIPSSATHLLAFAANASGRATTSVSTLIRDVDGLRFSPSQITVTAGGGNATTVKVVVSNDHTSPVTVNLHINFEGAGADLSREDAVTSSTSGTDGSSSRSSSSVSEVVTAQSVCSSDGSQPRVIFKWKSHVPEDGRRLGERRLASTHGIHKLHIFDRLDMQYADVYSDSTGNASDALVDELRKMADVEWAEKDRLVFATGTADALFQRPLQMAFGASPQGHMMRRVTPRSGTTSEADAGAGSSTPTLKPNDQRMFQQWALDQANDVDIDAPEAWAVHTGNGRHITVAVIDSGVDYNHQELVGQMWTNPGEIPDNGEDDDGNGLVDDYYGCRYASGTSSEISGDPLDDIGHGTHLAGALGAEANNEIGIAGTTWGAKILACKFLTPQGGSLTDAIKCLEYALSMGAQISLNAWGGPENSAALKSAIETARDQGHLFITAAGNNGRDLESSPFYPCSYDLDNIICVAATDQNDELKLTNWGASSVHIAAPGHQIMSTFLRDQYTPFSGSSTAAPFVAGAAALVWDYVPTMTYNEIRDVILANGDLVPKLLGKISSGRRLNIYKALQGAQSMQWARIQGGNTSIFVPEMGSERITIQLGGDRLGAGEYRASLKLSVGDLVRHIPIILLWHNFSGVPAVGAQAVEFKDLESTTGLITGALTITRAAASAEVQISQYQIFWGSSESDPLPSMPPFAVLDSGAVFRDEFVTADTTFWLVSSGAGVSYGDGHVRFKGSFKIAHLNYQRRVAAPFTLKARIHRSSALAGMVIQIGGTNPHLFMPGGGVQAVVAGNYKYLDVPGKPRQTVQCLGGLSWYEVTLTMGVDSVSFVDDQDCETLAADHTIEGPQSLLIGADCTGTCKGSDWDYVEVSGGAYAVFNVRETLVPAAATHILVYAWNPTGLQNASVSCPVNDFRTAIRADAPTSVTGSSPTLDSLVVSWSRGSMNDCVFRGYRVTARAEQATAWKTLSGCEDLIVSTLTSCTANSLASNTGYLFKVQVVCSMSEADSTESAASLAIKTLPEPAFAPIKVNAYMPTLSSLTVSWTSSYLADCEFSESVVETREHDSATAWAPPTGCTTLKTIQDNTCVASGLQSGRKYEFRVRTACVDSNANSPWSVPSEFMETRSRPPGVAPIPGT